MTTEAETADDILSSTTHSSRLTRQSLRLSRNALIFMTCVSLLTVRNFISIGSMNLSNFNDWIVSDNYVDVSLDEDNDSNQSIHFAAGNIATTDDDDEKNEEQKAASLPAENDEANDDETNDGETNDDDKESPETIEEGPHDSRMNVLLLYPDDWRHDSIGSEKPYVLTPFLDSLAKEGMRFTQNAVTTSVCWMSRATLWLGQYSSRHQSYKLKCPWMAAPENWKHGYVSIMQKAGYFVGHYGKWQYWTDPEKFTKHLFDWASLYEGWHWWQWGM